MSYKIIFENKAKQQLRQHELAALLLLLKYFDTNITCIGTQSSKTPDFKIGRNEWELKSPRGGGIRTIENILKKASKQSQNVILDLSRIKMSNHQALSRTRYYLRSNKHHGLKKLLVITKGCKIIDLTDNL